MFQIFSSMLKSRAMRKTFRQGVFKFVDATLALESLAPPWDPDRASHIAVIREMMATPVASCPGLGDILQYQALFDFLWAGRDLYSLILGHMCSETCRVEGRERCHTAAVAKGLCKTMMAASIFNHNPGRYNTARWRKTLPHTKYLARLLLVPGLVVAGLKAVMHASPNAKQGVRLKWLLGAVRSEDLRFRVLVLLMGLFMVEHIIEVLFGDSATVSDARDMHVPKRARRAEHVKFLSPAKRCVDAVASARRRLWTTFRDESAASPWRAVEKFFPAHLDQSTKYRLIQNQVVMLICDLAYRFEHEQWPWLACSAEGLDQSHAKWQELAALLLATPDCCLYPLVVQWKLRLAVVVGDGAGQLLFKLYHAFVRALRESTLKEEAWHAFLRDWCYAGAQRYTQKATGQVIECIRRTWAARGGRDLRAPLPKITKRLQANQIHNSRESRNRITTNRTVFLRPDRKTTTQEQAICYMHEKMKEQGLRFENMEQRSNAMRGLCREYRAKPEAFRRRYPCLSGFVGSSDLV